MSCMRGFDESFGAQLSFLSVGQDAKDYRIMYTAMVLYGLTHVSPRAGALVRVRGHGSEPLRPKGHPGYD